MKTWFALAVAATLLSACIGAGENSDVGAVATPGTAFPQVVGINLEGEDVALPAGFEGTRNLVAIGFEREHQTDIDTWIAVADELMPLREGLRFYEVPTIYELGAASRLWINNGMRQGIPASEARARTITVYLDRDAFNEALAISGVEDIHVLLLDEAGKVIWRAAGPVTADARVSLERALSGEI